MSERLWPEAICGAWFMGEPEGMEQAWREGVCDLYLFRVDGTFTRWGRRKGYVRETERGDYTFDGDFLITRGRNTETYRVGVEARGDWTLEDKKGQSRMVRRLVEQAALPEDAARDLRILPVRVTFAPLLEETPEVLLASYTRGEDEHALGLVTLERRRERGWAGVTRLESTLGRETWARAIAEGAPSRDEALEGLKALDVEFVEDGEVVEASLG
jgi:hypothetical protein